MIEATTDFTAAFSVDQTPQEVFAAINDVRGWWSGNIEGPTAHVGDEFTYRYKDVHYSKQRITAIVPNEKVVWQVLDSYLSFAADTGEWNGTRVIFEISKKGSQTEVRFTHQGLVPDVECFGDCSSAWTYYLTDSLRNLITTGHGEPNEKER